VTEDGAPTEPQGRPPLAAPRERRRPRRWVVALALLSVFALGVVGGIVADRRLSVDCRTCPPPAGEGTPLLGTVETVGEGVLAVRTPDGTLVALRTSSETRLMDETPSPLSGLPALGRGTPVRVLGVRDADGALTVTTVDVPR
jgi:hypothetical protein